MGSTAANQNPWTPYKDCSLGICSIYCPQFCYFIFPPPPPEDDSDTPFSPLIIAIIGVLVGAFILVSYYTIATRCCRRNPTTSVVAEDLHGGSAASGLEEAVIKTITVCKYQEGDGLIEGNECAVCLSEFQENEPLRLLPKCSHAFHLPCIDTWLKSHSNCPLCRAVVMSSAQPSPPPPSQAPTTMNSYEFQRPRDLVIVMDDGNADRDHGNAAAGTRKESLERDEEEGVSHFRRSRSVSLTTLPSQRHVFDGVKGGRSWRELGSSNGIGVEDRSGDVELVSSNSTARFMFMSRDKGKNTMLLPD